MRVFRLKKCPNCGSKNLVIVDSLYAHVVCNECGKHFGMVNGKLYTLYKGIFGVWIPFELPKERVEWI